MSNALNLIDGLDGLATGIALAASAAVFSMAFASGDALVMLVAVALIGSLLGFPVYNEIGRATGWARVGKYVKSWVVAVSIKNKILTLTFTKNKQKKKNTK